MSFADFPSQAAAVQRLQRSLERGRLGHAYLFSGGDLVELEALARTLAQTLNCTQPRRAPGGAAIDSCDACLACRKIGGTGHADVQWLRPESKSRIISVEQVRDLMQTVHLKPTEAEWKIAVIVAADRLHPSAANAFLKTLEEPPGRSVLLLLSTETSQILETVRSRCLRVEFASEGPGKISPEQLAWLAVFAGLATESRPGVMGRYRLLGALLGQLARLKSSIEEELTARSPLEKFEDVEPKLREKWEDELAAAIEAEYRYQRSGLLLALQWWLRDVWLQTLDAPEEIAAFPAARPAIDSVASRLTPAEALENLRVLEVAQRWLRTNAQEALALEVSLLKLKL